MRSARLLACVALLTALCVNPVQADDEGSSLAFELDALRRAWLYGDDATAIARLDALRGDNRLGGEFPRWFAFMRASLALQQADKPTALRAMQPVLDESTDARNFVRAARLCLAYDAADTALAVIRMGLQRAPDSRALQRWQAGLQWLGDDRPGALDGYLNLLAADDRPLYPYLTPASARWSQARPWNAAGDKPDRKNADKDGEDWRYPEEESDAYGPEPFTSPFMPLWWYPCDLPGLDRCLEELARDPAAAKAWRQRLGVLVKEARAVQDQLDTLRTGDDAVRKDLEQKARRARWQAVFAARIAARAHLLASEWNEAEAVADMALAVASEDVALLDLKAQALGELGRAEDARTGPLARLRTLCGLAVYSYSLYGRGPAQQIPDRVFTPALTLYRANPEAGLAQFELMRTTFGDSNRNQPVPPGTLGMWLMLHGEPGLARKLLQEASRTAGYESGKPLYQDGIYTELALVALGEGTETAEDEKNVQPAAPEGEEGVEVAKLDAAHPLLRKTLRAGAIIGAVPDTRSTLRELAGVDLWGSAAGIGSVQTAARMLPDGEALALDALYGLPARVAAEVPPAELDAFLAEGHATGESLKQALETIAELIQQVRASNNWQVRQSLSQKTGPVFGMMESRALLLRAKLLLDKPASLKALAEWLARYQPQIDLRARLQTRPGDAYNLFVNARNEAGVPEVVHTGLLLEAARVLARAGAPLDAARLVWLNRDAMLGLETHNRLLALASALARKGGDETLALRCGLEATTRAPDPRGRGSLNPQQLLFELPGARADLLEFGGKDDLLAYVEHQLVPSADTADMQVIERYCPELKDARPSLVMRNSSRVGTDGIFASSMQTGNCYVVVRNWYKMMISPETLPNCKRFAAWVICSDLPVSSAGGHNGLGSAQDQAAGWTLLLSLHARHGASDPKANKEAERLSKLLSRTSTTIDQQQYNEEDW
ncbi:MAG: hypothetical protein H6841_07625 [Planctomycetes bacterium]|nr:hypothetical protein [Planctomycetota bacterium]MCB9935227.1 hypothetical protein [Planctomycetota bacterium]